MVRITGAAPEIANGGCICIETVILGGCVVSQLPYMHNFFGDRWCTTRWAKIAFDLGVFSQPTVTVRLNGDKSTPWRLASIEVDDKHACFNHGVWIEEAEGAMAKQAPLLANRLRVDINPSDAMEVNYDTSTFTTADVRWRDPAPTVERAFDAHTEFALLFQGASSKVHPKLFVRCLTGVCEVKDPVAAKPVVRILDPRSDPKTAL